MGGKAANIIFADAAVDQAVEGIVNGIFFNQGHVCCAGSRLFVQESVADEVIQKLKDRMETLIVGDPLDKNIYDLPPEELAEIPSAPGSLDEALAALAEDNAFLLKGDVFTKDVIDMWIDYKTENEVNPVKLRPHPHEFHLYYDI